MRAPGHDLAKILNKVFSPYVGNTNTYLRNGEHFIQILRTCRFNKGIRVSLDAIALYPNIIVDLAIELLEQKLKNDRKLATRTNLSKQELLRLTKLCTKDPSFQCELGRFQQTDGAPMGGPLSRLLADLVLEDIESKIRANRKWKHKWDWVRYIDDTFMNWEDSLEELEEFITFLNSLHPKIKWTSEIEKDNQISFLDILIIRNGESSETTVYRKESCSDRYIHFSSTQAWQEKVAAIRTLKHRALTYCSNPTLLENELNHLLKVFLQNGFPNNTIQRILFKEKTVLIAPQQEIEVLNDEMGDYEVQSKSKDFSKTFFAPYHPKANRMFKMLKNKYNIDTVFKKTRTLGNILKHTSREPTDKLNQQHTVYKIPCQCPKAYYGESKRKMGTRLKEHQGQCKLADKTNRVKKDTYNDTGLPLHHKNEHHEFQWEQASILEIERDTNRRRLLEAIHIYKNKDVAVNVYSGKSDIPKSWFPTLDKLNLAPFKD